MNRVDGFCFLFGRNGKIDSDIIDGRKLEVVAFKKTDVFNSFFSHPCLNLIQNLSFIVSVVGSVIHGTNKI